MTYMPHPHHTKTRGTYGMSNILESAATCSSDYRRRYRRILDTFVQSLDDLTCGVFNLNGFLLFEIWSFVECCAKVMAMVQYYLCSQPKRYFPDDIYRFRSDEAVNTQLHVMFKSYIHAIDCRQDESRIFSGHQDDRFYDGFFIDEMEEYGCIVNQYHDEEEDEGKYDECHQQGRDFREAVRLKDKAFQKFCRGIIYTCDENFNFCTNKVMVKVVHKTLVQSWNAFCDDFQKLIRVERTYDIYKQRPWYLEPVPSGFLKESNNRWPVFRREMWCIIEAQRLELFNLDNLTLEQCKALSNDDFLCYVRRDRTCYLIYSGNYEIREIIKYGLRTGVLTCMTTIGCSKPILCTFVDCDDLNMVYIILHDSLRRIDMYLTWYCWLTLFNLV